MLVFVWKNAPLLSPIIDVYHVRWSRALVTCLTDISHWTEHEENMKITEYLHAATQEKKNNANNTLQYILSNIFNSLAYWKTHYTIAHTTMARSTTYYHVDEPQWFPFTGLLFSFILFKWQSIVMWCRVITESYCVKPIITAVSLL